MQITKTAILRAMEIGNVVAHTEDGRAYRIAGAADTYAIVALPARDYGRLPLADIDHIEVRK